MPGRAAALCHDGSQKGRAIVALGLKLSPLMGCSRTLVAGFRIYLDPPTTF